MEGTKFIYKDWTYELKNSNFNVIPPEGIETPSSVFKYYSNNKNSLDALVNQYLFCSHPYQLNDSIDSTSLLWDFSNLSKGIFEKFYYQYGFNKAYEVNYEKEKSEGFETIRHLFFNMVSKGAGIVSLTTEPLQTLMWAHYSSEYGFMVELDWKIVKDNIRTLNDNLKNYAFFPINYVERLESIDFFHNDFKGPDLPYLYSVGIKRDDWSYENEWRLMSFAMNYGIPDSILGPYPNIDGSSERKIYYPKEAIKSITLGKRFFNGYNLEEVINEVTYKIKASENPEVLTDIDFINLLHKDFNDRIYFCGEFENDRIFKRSAEKIHFEKIDERTFKIIREDEGFYQR